VRARSLLSNPGIGCTFCLVRIGANKLRKLIEQFLRDPPEVCFDDVQYLLESFGFEEKRSKGSHHTCRNSDGLKITVPKKSGRIVKGVYAQQIVKLLNLENWNDENTD
jgi:predicted RNA binding protein YcfA (HicA-like mRNA interferase family)